MRRIITAICLLFLLSSPLHAELNRGEIRDEIREITRDNQADTERQRLSDSLLNERINIAQTDIVAETRCLTVRIRITTIAGQREYILPEIVGEILRVSYSISTDTTTYHRLPRVTLNKLDKDNKSWDDESSGDPEYYYTRRNRIGLTPPAGSDYAGTKYLQIDSVRLPDTLDEDSDYPFNNQKRLYPYHKLIVWYVAMLCMIDEGDINRAKAFNDMYYAGIKSIKTDMKTEEDNYEFGNFRPGLR